MRRSSRLLLALPPALALGLLALLLGAPAPGHGVAAQGTGWAPVATWRSQDVALPAGSWRISRGMDIGADGRIYVVDAGELRLSAIDGEGNATVLGSADGAGSGLRAAAHLAVDVARDRIYVADPVEGAVAVFDLAGVRLDTWGGVPVATGLAVAPDGAVVAGARDRGEIVVFAPDGTERARWQAVVAAEPGDLLRGLDVDVDGKVYAVDAERRRMRVFDAAGAALEDLPFDTTDSVEIHDLAVDYYPEVSPGRRYWFASTIGLYATRGPGAVWEIMPRGGVYAIDAHPAVGTVATIPGARVTPSTIVRYRYAVTGVGNTPESVWGGPVALPGVLDQPEVLVLGADGKAYVLDRAARVQRYAPDGVSEGQLVPPELKQSPLAATAGPDGTRYVTDGGTLAAYAEDGTQTWLRTVAPMGEEGVGIALAWDAAAGELVALDPLQEVLHRFDANGTRRRNPDELPSARDGSTIWGDLDVDAAGDAYVLDRANDRVHVLPADGSEPRAIDLAARARQLAVAPDGAFFTLARDGWVRAYAPDGGPRGAFDATRFDEAPASAPSDLAAVPDGSVLVSDRSADVISRFAPDPDAPPATAPDDEATCRSFPDKRAAPERVDLGDEVEVRLTVRGGCGSAVSGAPQDLLLVLDRSGSMGGERMLVLKEAAARLLADVDYDSTRVGVISFNERARLEVGLTDDAGQALRAVRNLVAEGETDIRQGLREARLELGRRGRADVQASVILFSDGLDSGRDLRDMQREAEQLARTGAEIYTIGIGVPTSLMAGLATDEDHYFVAANTRFLYAIFEKVSARVTSTLLFREIEVLDELPANMELVPGSAEPAPDEVQGRSLRWSLRDVPFTGFALAYRVRPREEGRWPTNVFARGDYVDGFGAPGRLDFPVPEVLVVGPTPTPTLTPEPTPTGQPSPSASPTAPPTATRTPAPPVPIYIPVALREETCQPGQRHADAMLVLDASSSMAGEKLAAAKDAAVRFVAQLDLPADQVGVVAFDEQARLLARLGEDAATLEAAIRGLETGSGTRIDRGLEAALAELLGSRARPGNTPAIVLLTDGRQPEEDQVLEVAAEARAAGVRIYAIGLGADVDVELLRRAAGDPARAFLAVRPSDLRAIYEEIAGDVPCPADVYWGRR